jgi:hypothetical protein
MCLNKKKVSTPDTSVQEAEAARQRAIEEQRARERAAAEQGRYDQQRADDERRYQAQLQAQQAEAERQRQMMQAEIERQTAEQRRIEALRESERQQIVRQQQERAEQTRQYTTGRQVLIEQAESDINAAYSGFDDGYFQDFAQSFVQQHAPELARQVQAKARGTTMDAARRGAVNSSATARQFGDLNREKVKAETQLAGEGQNAAQGFRTAIDGQKRDALTSIWSAGAVGAENLPDGVNDANAALGGIGAQLGSLTATARNRAATVKAPQFF